MEQVLESLLGGAHFVMNVNGFLSSGSGERNATFLDAARPNLGDGWCVNGRHWGLRRGLVTGQVAVGSTDSGMPTASLRTAWRRRSSTRCRYRRVVLRSECRSTICFCFSSLKTLAILGAAEQIV